MISVHGRVQGVGFRHFVSSHARRLGIRGWVRNERDGSVRIAAAGRPEDMDEFVTRVSLGPPSSRVESLQTGPLDAGESKLPDPFEVGY
ncbi:MAG: acylphosphatase [Rhodothermia bacterium]|nr:acylphosphatase [Rhodothermia bacterium]